MLCTVSQNTETLLYLLQALGSIFILSSASYWACLPGKEEAMSKTEGV